MYKRIRYTTTFCSILFIDTFWYMVIIIKYFTTRYIMVKITIVVNLTHVRLPDSADEIGSQLKVSDLLNYYKIIKRRNIH